MIVYNVSDLISLKVDVKLPYFAKVFLADMGTPAKSDQALPYSLTVKRGFSDLPAKNGWLKFDLCRIAENVLEWQAQYKFSRWKYRLYRLTENDYQLEIDGDFFSQWVWPFRTVGMILRLLRIRSGMLQIHAAGFYNGLGAVLVLASSGTGKTLTTLHYLCNGGKVYNDDTVIWQNGKLQPTLTGIPFWENRYRNTPEVLPKNMPVFSSKMKQKQRFSCWCNKLTAGYLSLGVPIPVAEYWPDAQPPPAPIEKIIILRKGAVFRRIEGVDNAIFLNMVNGDMELQCLPMLRIAELEKLTGFSLLDTEKCLQQNRSFVNTYLKKLPFSVFEVPKHYSAELFESIKQEILS